MRKGFGSRMKNIFCFPVKISALGSAKVADLGSESTVGGFRA